MFADTVIDSGATWAAAFTAMAVTAGLICQIALQLLARSDAAKKAKKDDELAMEAKKAIVEAKKIADVAAVKVEQVKADLKESNLNSEQKLDEIVKVTAVIHKLTNSQHGASLRLTSDLSDWKAKQTRDPVDIEAARVAKKLSVDHETEQAKIDARETANTKI